MCFSATANFVGSAALGAVGVVTITRVKHRRELLFAALPLLFAIHQFIEGFVWLGLDGILSPAVAHNMGAAFMLYAQGLLPYLLPLSVWLFEPDKNSRQRMLPFFALGGATTLYILWALTAFPTDVYVKSNSIVYMNPATNNTAVGVLYVIATCGSLFFSKIRMMVLFGAANLIILLAVMEVKRYAFTSLWCAYAAVASVIILAYFWSSHPDRPFRYAYAPFASATTACHPGGTESQAKPATSEKEPALCKDAVTVRSQWRMRTQRCCACGNAARTPRA